MQRLFACVLLGFTCLGMAGSIRPSRPVKLSPDAVDSLRRAAAAERVETERWLRESPTSYLAAIHRVDFDGANALTVGRSAQAQVRLADSSVAMQHLRVTVVGDSFHVVALDAGATFGWNKGTHRDAVLPPASITVGRYTLRLSHQRYPALIVFDPSSPRFAEYKGLAVYPYDPRYRFELAMTPNTRADTTIIESTRGHRRRAVLAGWFDMLVHGTPVRLEAHRLLEPGVDENSISIFFRDATTGRETYPVGRYLDPERLANGLWRVDFNNAYNPACAVSPHYNCPIPSRANRLKLAIRAGEKDSHYAH